jgi:hypothetical protein
LNRRRPTAGARGRPHRHRRESALQPRRQPALQRAKAHLRYAVHRANDQGQRQYREVWDRDGVLDKTTAYERLDQVKPQEHIYRFTLSPHPERQDASRTLDLRSWTRDVLGQLERNAGQRLEWFAVTHDHRDHRHVHAVLMSRRHLDSRHFQAMREAGDANARGQQRLLERRAQDPRQTAPAPQREREPTTLHRADRRQVAR